VKSAESTGIRVGNWLSARQAQSLLNPPDIKTVRRLRHRAIWPSSSAVDCDDLSDGFNSPMSNGVMDVVLVVLELPLSLELLEERWKQPPSDDDGGGGRERLTAWARSDREASIPGESWLFAGPRRVLRGPRGSSDGGRVGREDYKGARSAVLLQSLPFLESPMWWPGLASRVLKLRG